MFTHVTIREYDYKYSSVFHFFEIAIFIVKYTKQKSTFTPFLLSRANHSFIDVHCVCSVVK